MPDAPRAADRGAVGEFMSRDQKRFYRNLKRAVKKTGNRKRRNYLKKQLKNDPVSAHEAEFEFGGNSSEWLNAIDRRK